MVKKEFYVTREENGQTLFLGYYKGFNWCNSLHGAECFSTKHWAEITINLLFTFCDWNYDYRILTRSINVTDEKTEKEKLRESLLNPGRSSSC